MFNLTAEEENFLRLLDTPLKIQDYLDSIPFNFEIKGETCMSPIRVLKEKRANCIEGAMVAAVCLFFLGHKMLLLNLKVEEGDDDHVVALFKINSSWGAISKTNHSVLRYRDPVYVSTRELAMSYFHEYFLVQDGKKTMKGFSKPINLRKFGTRWITSKEELWNIAETIFFTSYTPTIPTKNKKYIRNASALERKSSSISEWNKNNRL